MAGIKSFLLPILFMVIGGSGMYIYMEMKDVSDTEEIEVGSRTAVGNTRGAGGQDRQKLMASYKEESEASCKLKNKFVTKELGKGYPEAFPLMDILNNWSPDKPEAEPSKLYQSLRHFNYETELAEASKYRKAEVPFVIKNVPAVNAARAKWSWEWLHRKIDNVEGRVELPTGDDGDGAHGNNHLMFWRSGGADPKSYKPPTRHTRWNFKKWYSEASKKGITNDSPHYYYHLWGKRSGEGGWIYRVLGQDGGFAKKKSFFVPDPSKNRGILCRFGMQGTVAETHFDMNRNMVSIVRGRKRYILMKPEECQNVYFYDNNHPSRRHSMVVRVDFSRPEAIDFTKYPKMKKALGFEVVLEEGDVLYIPSYWMHYIVGLDLNIQCNTRSGLLKQDPYADSVRPCLV